MATLIGSFVFGLDEFAKSTGEVGIGENFSSGRGLIVRKVDSLAGRIFAQFAVALWGGDFGLYAIVADDERARAFPGGNGPREQLADRESVGELDGRL